MDKDKLVKLWKTEEDNFELHGWDFTYLDNKWESPEAPWDYVTIIRTYLKDSNRLLDLGTGGGEVLLTIGHPHSNTYVTEGYFPNLELCIKQLSPLGVTVKQSYEDDKIPYEDDFFDFIINRHESFDVAEVDRTLKCGGYYFTQQVINKNHKELAEILNGFSPDDYPNHGLDFYANAFTKIGYKVIIRDEVILPTKFFDVSAVIFYAKAIPWEIFDFSVDTHLDKLFVIQDIIDKDGFFQATSGRFLFGVQKPVS